MSYFSTRLKEKLFQTYFSKFQAEMNTFFSEKRTKIIKNIFKEQFENQEKNVGNSFSVNLKIMLEEIKKKSQEEVKNLGKEVSDLSLARSQVLSSLEMLEEKVKHLEKEYENLKNRYQEFYEIHVDPDYEYNKLVDQEDRSRRYTLRIDGATETRNKTREQCDEAVQAVPKEKLGLDIISIE